MDSSLLDISGGPSPTAAAPADAALDAAGERLRAAFARACAAQAIDAELAGPAAAMELRFAGQENAAAARIHQAFVDELRAVGVAAGSHVCPRPGMDEATLRRAEKAIGHAVARVRTLLIEHNSYMSGGMAWVFGDGAPARLRDRGLAVYRFPATAAVDVTAEPDAVRIAFARGDLGEVTSSGFYVPTRLRGDFDARASYRLLDWQPGPRAACFALFAQDEPSLLRYYSQRRSAGDGGHEVLGNFNNAVFTTPLGVTDREGAFGVQRVGASVRIWHRAGRGGDWQRLGSHDGDPTRDVVIGAKIWSSGACGGLVAELRALRITAEVPADQMPEADVRPDPRRS